MTKLCAKVAEAGQYCMSNDEEVLLPYSWARFYVAALGLQLAALLVFLGLIYRQLQKNKEVDAMGATAGGGVGADEEGEVLVEDEVGEAADGEADL